MSEEKTVAQMAMELKDAIKSQVTASDEVKKIAETSSAEVKNLGKVTDETKQKADEALVKANEINARIDEIEQKMVRRGTTEQQARKSIGQQVVENDDVKNFMARKSARGSVNVSLKAIISSATADADGSAGDLLRPDRQSGIIAPPNRRMTVRDLLTPGRTSSNAIEYVRETGFTNAAAVVAEAGTKPESGIKFDLFTTPVATIAHWVQATKQILDDAPMLQSYIDGRLRYGLEYVEENQLLMGSGTGGNLNGIYTQASAYAAPSGAPGSPTAIDILRLAILQAYLAEYPATGIVLHPTDWALIELTKDSQGRYIIGDPQNGAAPRLWRLPVVDTQAMTRDKFLVGAFRLGAQIFDREDANVEISTEDRDNFIKNLVTIRAEERLGLAVYRPEAFVKGDLGYVA